MAASDDASWDANLQSEYIIAEVKKRPILYNKSLPEYNNKLLKNKIWEDIVRNMSSDWEEITDLVRTVRCRDVQTKWKHIRDNFRRDWPVNSKDMKGKKKKKYRYFDHLSFLAPHITDSPSKDTKKHRDDNAILLQETVATKRKHTPERKLEVEVLEALSKRNAEPDNDDDDKAFCLSLVKPMRKIDDANKLTARMEILNVIRKFSYPEQHLLYSEPCHECPCASQAKRIKTSDRPQKQSGHNRTNVSSTAAIQGVETYNLTEEVILPVHEVKIELEDE